LRDTIDGLRGMMDLLDIRFTAIEQDPELSPVGRKNRAAEMARATLAELAEYAPLRKAQSAVVLLPNVALTCDPGPFAAAIIATAIPAAMRPYSMRHREAFGRT
jgi:hypothetical protein